MALVPEWVLIRIKTLENKVVFLEEQLALIVEALAPVVKEEKEDVDSN